MFSKALYESFCIDIMLRQIKVTILSQFLVKNLKWLLSFIPKCPVKLILLLLLNQHLVFLLLKSIAIIL